jgi:SAM-dependent methyltransferase
MSGTSDQGTTPASDRLGRILPTLICPACHGPLEIGSDAATCGGCSRRYRIEDRRIYFIEPPARTDELDTIKGWLKRRLGQLYYRVGVDVIAPTFPFRMDRPLVRLTDPGKDVVVDVGCGSQRLHPDVICADAVDYENVDVVCDARRLPFRSGSIDCLVSQGLLEHLPDPFGAVREMQRCTRRSGINLLYVPFLYPFHASPDDFFRYTHRGLEVLYGQWRLLECRNTSGPFSLGLSVFIDVASVVLSFGIPRLEAYLYLALSGLLFPIKFLDLPFIHRRAMLRIAPTIFAAFRNETTVDRDAAEARP